MRRFANRCSLVGIQLRELQEETGYIGKVVETEDGSGISCIMFNDPGTTNMSIQLPNWRLIPFLLLSQVSATPIYTTFM